MLLRRTLWKIIIAQVHVHNRKVNRELSRHPTVFRTLVIKTPLKYSDFKASEHLFERKDDPSYIYGSLRCVWCYGFMPCMMLYGHGTSVVVLSDIPTPQVQNLTLSLILCRGAVSKYVISSFLKRPADPMGGDGHGVPV